MALQTLSVVETYDSFQILKEQQLNDAMTSIEQWAAFTNLDITQLSKDIFGTYTFNNNGAQTLITPLVDSFAELSSNETITGSWTFDNNVEFTNVVEFSNIVNFTAQPRIRCYRVGGNQTIPNTTQTELSFNFDSFDIGDLHSPTIGNERITIPSGTSGVYDILGQATFVANATGVRHLILLKNGSEVARVTVPNLGLAIAVPIQVSYFDTVAPSDFFTLAVYHDAGAPLDVLFGESKTFFSACKRF